MSSGPVMWAGALNLGSAGHRLKETPLGTSDIAISATAFFLEVVKLHKEHKGWLFDVDANHVGRTDQRYIGRVIRPGRLKVNVLWDRIPECSEPHDADVVCRDRGRCPPL